jgi:ATP-dependent DNA helicase RecG
VASRQPVESTRGDLTSPIPGLRAWCAPLQKACELEAERGFCDLQGRADTFSGFVRRSLGAPPEGLEAADWRQLDSLREGFNHYGAISASQRQHLVRQLRQGLHQLQCRLRPSLPVAPPRLRLASPGASGEEAAPKATLEPTTPLARVPGLGPKLATRLARLGLFLVEDLLRHYPRDYLNYANLVRIGSLVAGTTATVVGTVRRSHTVISAKNPNLSILELQLQDVTGRLKVSRFFAGRRFANPGWLKTQQRLYPPGCTVAVSGLVRETSHGLSLHDPLIEVLASPSSPVRSEQIGRLVPVYPLTEGLTADALRQAIAKLLPLVRHWPDPLPVALRASLAPLPSRSEALEQLHRPSDPTRLQEARRRLVFDEFLLLQLAIALRRQRLKAQPAPSLLAKGGSESLIGRLLALLPFSLTGAQQRVLEDIVEDLAKPQPMARLLQGDVGSGKTVVALAALLTSIDSGCQGALMAPTEVLAEQHLRKLQPWLAQLHVSTGLLTGSTPARRRRQLLQDVLNGQIQLLVGTHALLEDPVQFQRLGLVVVDEQHRFGVHQRNRLLAKGLQPHLLTMTATPIPRTLALSIHGDLDVSQIDGLPPGRTPVRTRLLRADQRQEAWRLIREQVALGQRAYVVLPLVEESETLDLRSAVEVHRQLAEETFADLTVGLLHGRLTSEEKQRALGAFATGVSQILVSTTVVEVGVDVPEATVMVIEHAERFGLAQLHQLRGRVGRGAAASHCLLVNASSSPLARQRLDVLVRSNDGFEIAEMDLRLRGPGQILGTRQSGLPDLALASLSEDGEVLDEARRVAQELVARDPGLVTAPLLREALLHQRQRWQEAAQLN